MLVVVSNDSDEPSDEKVAVLHGQMFTFWGKHQLQDISENFRCFETHNPVPHQEEKHYKLFG